MNDPARFEADWLSLREPADRAARSSELVERLRRWLATWPAGRCVDLGSGHGSNLRYLADHLPGALDWLLIDRDEDLLSRASQQTIRTHPRLTVATRSLDLADLRSTDIADARLVTASALFDLASRDWIHRLAASCRQVGAAVLFTLTVDGRRHFEDAAGERLNGSDDACGDDAWMTGQFNAHQRRAKGLGDALGPDAARELPIALNTAGFDVMGRASDWRLRAGEPQTLTLGKALLDGWRDAVLESAPEASTRVGRWHERRTRALAAGRIGLRVGHVDVLGLPPQQ
ncbi:MAG: class I SAM-dependent methyltransferase [Wenzhouxiangella sp.]|nr:class I SAM-dependent methyltransferase [Wenzhouxiangella sp.]